MAYKIKNSKQAAISRKEWIRRRRGEQPTAVVQSRGTSGSSSSGTPLVDEAWRELFSLENIGTEENPVLAICAKYGLFSHSFISAGGVSATSGGAGGASSLSELTDVVLGTLADGEVLMYSSGSWRNKAIDLTSYAKLTNLASYATKASLADYVTITDLASQGYISVIDSEMVVNALGYTPLKDHQSLAGYATEAWVIGKGYATTSDLDGRINALVNGAPAAYDTLKEIADVLAGNVNSIGDIMTALGNKADKATTLAGYGITDAYTSSEVDTKLGGYLPLSGGTLTGSLTAATINATSAIYGGSLFRMYDTDGSTPFNIIQRNRAGDVLIGDGKQRDAYFDFDAIFVRSSSTKFSYAVTAPSFIGSLAGNADSSTISSMLSSLDDSQYSKTSLQFKRGSFAPATSDSAVRDWVSPYTTTFYGSAIRLNYGSQNHHDLLFDANTDKVFLRRGATNNVSQCEVLTTSASSVAFAARDTIGQVIKDFNAIDAAGGYSNQAGNYEDCINGPLEQYGTILAIRGSSQYFASQIHCSTTGVFRFRVRKGSPTAEWTEWIKLTTQPEVNKLSETVTANKTAFDTFKASFDEMFEIDANGYIHAKKGLYSDSFISAGGVSTSESIIADLQARVAVLEQQIALLKA